jgi:hypothetical protein
MLPYHLQAKLEAHNKIVRSVLNLLCRLVVLLLVLEGDKGNVPNQKRRQEHSSQLRLQCNRYLTVP